MRYKISDQAHKKTEATNFHLLLSDPKIINKCVTDARIYRNEPEPSELRLQSYDEDVLNFSDGEQAGCLELNSAHLPCEVVFQHKAMQTNSNLMKSSSGKRKANSAVTFAHKKVLFPPLNVTFKSNELLRMISVTDIDGSDHKFIRRVGPVGRKKVLRFKRNLHKTRCHEYIMPLPTFNQISEITINHPYKVNFDDNSLFKNFKPPDCDSYHATVEIEKIDVPGTTLVSDTGENHDVPHTNNESLRVDDCCAPDLLIDVERHSLHSSLMNSDVTSPHCHVPKNGDRGSLLGVPTPFNHDLQTSFYMASEDVLKVHSLSGNNYNCDCLYTNSATVIKQPQNVICQQNHNSSIEIRTVVKKESPQTTCKATHDTGKNCCCCCCCDCSDPHSTAVKEHLSPINCQGIQIVSHSATIMKQPPSTSYQELLKGSDSAAIKREPPSSSYQGLVIGSHSVAVKKEPSGASYQGLHKGSHSASIIKQPPSTSYQGSHCAAVKKQSLDITCPETDNGSGNDCYCSCDCAYTQDAAAKKQPPETKCEGIQKGSYNTAVKRQPSDIPCQEPHESFHGAANRQQVICKETDNSYEHNCTCSCDSLLNSTVAEKQSAETKYEGTDCGLRSACKGTDCDVVTANRSIECDRKTVNQSTGCDTPNTIEPRSPCTVAASKPRQNKCALPKIDLSNIRTMIATNKTSSCMHVIDIPNLGAVVIHNTSSPRKSPAIVATSPLLSDEQHAVFNASRRLRMRRVLLKQQQNLRLRVEKEDMNNDKSLIDYVFNMTEDVKCQICKLWNRVIN